MSIKALPSLIHISPKSYRQAIQTEGLRESVFIGDFVKGVFCIEPENFKTQWNKHYISCEPTSSASDKLASYSYASSLINLVLRKALNIMNYGSNVPYVDVWKINLDPSKHKVSYRDVSKDFIARKPVEINPNADLPLTSPLEFIVNSSNDYIEPANLELIKEVPVKKFYKRHTVNSVYGYMKRCNIPDSVLLLSELKGLSSVSQLSNITERNLMNALYHENIFFSGDQFEAYAETPLGFKILMTRLDEQSLKLKKRERSIVNRGKIFVFGEQAPIELIQ